MAAVLAKGTTTIYNAACEPYLHKHLMQIMGEDAVAILPAALVHIRNRDAEFQYRQDSDFHYITGFDEPEAVVVLVPGREHGEFILFCRENDKKMETWNGLRAG